MLAPKLVCKVIYVGNTRNNLYNPYVRLLDINTNETLNVFMENFAYKVNNSTDISVVNLKGFNTDNEGQLIPIIIDTEEDIKYRKNLENIISKSKLLGYKVNVLRIKGFTNDIYLITQKEGSYIVVIPDNVDNDLVINEDVYSRARNYTYYESSFDDFYDVLESLDLCGDIKVIGGRNLTNTFEWFTTGRLSTIDLSQMCAYNLTNMTETFFECYCDKVILPSNTCSVTDMQSMFERCNIKQVDLSVLKTSKVENMNRMFYASSIPIIDISKFNINNLKSAGLMIDGANFDKLILNTVLSETINQI